MVESARSSQQASGTFELISKSPEATEQFGERLGRALAAGDVIALVGELGSGKTTLVRGLAKGLGVDSQRVKSPTFILLREYAGPVPLIHMDGYRVAAAPIAVWDDLDWVFSPQKVTVIEWGDLVRDCLPEDFLELHLDHKSANQRLIRAVAHGPRSQQVAEAWRQSAGDS